MKGIILAGGRNTRLYPTTLVTSKQALPLYDKPMIYYPLSVLLQMRLREILIISSPAHLGYFRSHLGDGSELGIKIEYAAQIEPKGIADALLVGEEFIGGGDVCLILGDNFFFGEDFSDCVVGGAEDFNGGARIFACRVKNPREFGVVEFDRGGNILSIEEKPAQPKSDYAVTGLYIYDKNVIEIAKNVPFSPRGELEITAVNEEYFKRGKLKLQLLGKTCVWHDTGTHDAMLHVSNFIQRYQKREDKFIGCIEEIAFENGFIDKKGLIALSQKYRGTVYAKYLIKVCGVE